MFCPAASALPRLCACAGGGSVFISPAPCARPAALWRVLRCPAYLITPGAGAITETGKAITEIRHLITPRAGAGAGAAPRMIFILRPRMRPQTAARAHEAAGEGRYTPGGLTRRNADTDEGKRHRSKTGRGAGAAAPEKIIFLPCNLCLTYLCARYIINVRTEKR